MKSNPTKQSTTAAGERDRLSAQDTGRIYLRRGVKYGTIREVHESMYAAQIFLQEGGLAQGGEFIPISNPWQQLIHDFGNLRPGLLVEITYTGDQESSSVARVIGLEGEKLAQLQQEPEIDLALYEIFSPGI